MGAAVLTDAPLCQPLLPGDSDPWTAAANDVVEISIYTGAADSTPTRRFHPTYTHQIFSHDETVSGYRGLSVDVSFNASKPLHDSNPLLVGLAASFLCLFFSRLLLMLLGSCLSFGGLSSFGFFIMVAFSFFLVFSALRSFFLSELCP